MSTDFPRKNERCLPDNCAHNGANEDKSEAGFSIVELLVVLAIIGLIAGLAVPRVLQYLGSARTETAQTQIKSIGNAMELYYIDNGGYPSSAEGIAALSKPPAQAKNWNGPYLKSADKLLDPWNRPYIYKLGNDQNSFIISSLGRDGEPKGEGEDADINN